MEKCCILILLDGVGDRSFPSLDNKTPLQAAHTPNFDTLAAVGSNGLLHATSPGRALPSEEAHFAIFGYELDAFPGRGYLEAIGAGCAISADDVAMLSHFASIEIGGGGEVFIRRHRPEATSDEIEELIAAIDDWEGGGLSFHFSQTKKSDGILCISGGASPHVTDTDPIYEGIPMLEPRACAESKHRPRADHTARQLKSYLEWCIRTLNQHPVNLRRKAKGLPQVNAILTQRAGRFRPAEPFSRKWGLKALSIGSGVVYQGLAKHLDMTFHEIPDTNDAGEDLARRLDIALSLTSDYSFIHVHTKAPDEAAHTKDPIQKAKVLEKLDDAFARVLPHLKREDLFVILTADHSTPSSGPLIHSGEPVPISIAGPGIRRDSIMRFNEIDCSSGALGQMTGRDFMPIVLNSLDRIRLEGLRDDPACRPYWPGIRGTFRIGGA